ncbi:C25 family cysteine peptidase [Candidatus Uabimicrobium amorphum]|uniref:Lys-gingipain W83 n=1 Tax=Uabimicrobium amorphum TaxID=2596890 RepID=A0A5S9IU65_UABAM|nr:C25 family cysteine peptidase [Candidatus Uabimicrobium amorphum]BBM87230.1 Lys-gingipain W83 [Candidatus Uabimicrobium amorphum]
MKKYLILLLVPFISALFADEIFLSRTTEETNTKIVSEDMSSEIGSTTIRFHIKSVFTEEVETAKGKFTRLYVPGCFNTNQEGTPKLPVASRLVEVPYGCEVTAKIESSVEREFDLAAIGIHSPISPYQPSVCKQDEESEYKFNPVAYATKYSKTSPLRVKEVGIMHNYRIILLQMQLANYSPADNKIKFYNNIVVKLTYNKLDMNKVSAFKQKYSSRSFDVLTTRVLTSKKMARFSRDRAPLKYVIVSDPMFKNSLQRFISHKEKMGYTVVTAYTDKVGKTPEQIKSFIQKEYDNPSDGIIPSFLLLVGDNEQIPAWKATQGAFITDLYYSLLKGEDFIPDVLAGRFSAKTINDLEPQIDKTIVYENAQTLDNEYLNRILMVAGWDPHFTQKRGVPHLRYALKYYLTAKGGYKNVKDSTFLSTGSQQNVAAIKNAFDRGVGVFNYTAHGVEDGFVDPEMKNSDIKNLANFSMYPVVIANCCLTGAFDTDACFAEAMVRAKDKGAVAFVGASSFTFWDEDLWWGVGYTSITSNIEKGLPPLRSDTGTGAYDYSFQKLKEFTNSGMMLTGNMAVQEANSFLTKYYFEVYHLFGDPGISTFWAKAGK